MTHPKPRDEISQRVKSLADELKRLIQDEGLKPGHKLPTEQELAKRDDLSREIVRRAYDRLRQERVVERRRGSGTYVLDPNKAFRRVSNARYLAEVDQGGAAPERRSIRSDEQARGDYAVIPASPDVAAALDIEEGELVLERSIHYLSGGRLIELLNSHIPHHRIVDSPALDPDREPWRGGIRAQLNSAGIDVTKTREIVHSRLASDEEARLFKIPYDSRLFDIARETYDGHGIVEIANQVRTELDTEIEIVTTIQ